MKKILAILVLILSFSLQAEASKTFVKGTLSAVKQDNRGEEKKGRPIYFFTIKGANGKTYKSEFVRHTGLSYKPKWKAGDAIEYRINDDSTHLYIKKPNGGDLKTDLKK